MAFSRPECQKTGTLRTRATLPRMKKGPLAEALIVKYLRDSGFTRAERRLMGGARDRGDIAGIPGLMIEVKNEQKMSLAEWIDEALREAQDGETPVVWHKRRAKTSPADWYVTMTGKHFTELWMASVGAWQAAAVLPRSSPAGSGLKIYAEDAQDDE